MSFESKWVPSTPGVRVNYGTQEPNQKGGGQASSSGKVKELVWRFKYNDLPSENAGSGLEIQLPAGAQVLDAHIRALVDFAGGTSYDIGLSQPDGTVIDADGLFAAVALADVNAGAVGSGALIGTKLGATGELTVAATGTFTAGEAEVVVRYIK